MTNEEFIYEVMKLTAGSEDQSYFMWYINSRGDLVFVVECSDAFHWATADAEEVTPENIHYLRMSMDDIARLQKENPEGLYCDYEYIWLFCARVRKQKLQEPVMTDKYLSPGVRELIEEAATWQ